MEQPKTSNVISFPKQTSVHHPEVLHRRLVHLLTELLEFYDDLADFVEDCGQAIGHRSGVQADRALHSWARRQLEEYRFLAAQRG